LRKHWTFRFAFELIVLSLAVAISAAAADRILIGQKERVDPVEGENPVHHRCLTPTVSSRLLLDLERDKVWSLPKKALNGDFFDTLNILVLRYNFQYEDIDDPNTTGRGHINLSTDTAAFFDSAGHMIDPPPHDSLYFDAHLRALRTYWEIVSEGKITLTWDIYPPAPDSVYELAEPMSHYGRCAFDEIVAGLEQYFIDCIQLADTVSPELHFGDYESIFLFHAGSDRQNDIGFPTTCNDLFTGFIRFGDSIEVDTGAYYVREALLMPETSNQDNRATALNAVMAHEFGHQLGLVDLYSTATFMSQLGDFALMDNNGFATGIDFGFDVGRVFGAIPLYPTAWSRAYLGFVDVVDFRQGDDIRLVAAEIVSGGIKIARIPITENEYYLIENRLIDIDGQQAAARADSATGVILGPVDMNLEFNREYDFLMPGSGVLIYHVDERVAGLDYDGDGLNNFEDNDLQWPVDINGNLVDRFITLVEADGRINFGGYYRSGYGSEDDMYRDDRNDSFTPNTNPPTIDNSGNNTHIYVTDIRRAPDTTAGKEVLMDSVILFDVETDRLVSGFPVRGGVPSFGLSPIADDLDGDGTDEIIFASGRLLNVVTAEGENFLREFTQCTTCPLYYDSALASVHPGREHPVPLYVPMPSDITAGPVTGNLADVSDPNKLVAVGYASGINGRVTLFRLADVDSNGEADPARPSYLPVGTPIAMSFGEDLFVLTDTGFVYQYPNPVAVYITEDREFHGICRMGSGLMLLSGDEQVTNLHLIGSGGVDTAFISLGTFYTLGPAVADLDLDGVPEVVAATRDGDIIAVSVDLTNGVGNSPFSIHAEIATGFPFTANPIISDVDLDGYPDIVLGGTNAVYAFNRELTLKTDFPVEINDRFPWDEVIAAPVTANIDGHGVPEIVFPTMVGNVYSYGLKTTYGFPLSAGEIGAGSSVILSDENGGMLGYLGADGWFYLWETSADTSTDFWPMGGADPQGSFNFVQAKLPAVKQYADLLPEEQFYNYPNPVVDGGTVIRYFLGDNANSVDLTIYDLSGQEVAKMSGPGAGGVDNEIYWACGDVTPGVYRCIINVEFDSQSETAFTDIAIIK